jgi:hypothetical protein
MTTRDTKIVVIHGKNPIKANTVAESTPKNVFKGPNIKKLEDAIDKGEKTVPDKISSEDSANIRKRRNAIKIDGKTLTQDILAQKSNIGKVASGITSKDIQEIENGTFSLTHPNKLKLTAIKRALSLLEPKEEK